MGETLTRSVRAVTGTGGTCPSLFVLLYSVSARCALGLAHSLHLWHLPVLESNGNYHTSLSLPARGLNAAGRSSRVTPRYVGRVLEIRKISEQATALGRARARTAHINLITRFAVFWSRRLGKRTNYPSALPPLSDLVSALLCSLTPSMAPQ